MSRYLSRCLVVAAALPMALAPAHAEHRAGHAGEVSEADFLSDLPVVLSASRLAQPLRDAPGAVTVIDRDMIKASGAREIADLLRLVPGFNVSLANGANPVVNYHGLTGQFNPGMQVLVDGRSYYSPYFLGGVDWNLLPVALEDIERIEVFRGSNSVTYGANAFMGVANIVTRDPTQTRGVLASANLGTQGIRDNFFRYGGGREGLDYRLSVARREDTGFDDVHDTKHVSHFNFRGDLRVNPRDVLQLYFGAVETSAGAGFPDDPTNPVRTQQASHAFAQLQWRRALGPDEELSLTGQHVRDGGVESYFSPFPLFLDFGRRTERSSLELQHILRPSTDVRLVWGLEHRVERVYSPLLFNTRDWQTATGSRAFGNLEWRARPWLLVNAGAMGEHYSLTGNHLSPRLMLNFQPAPEHTIRVGASRAIRTPSLLEEKGLVQPAPLPVPVFQGNDSLRPASVTAREVSYLGEFRPYGLTLDARLFQERIRDLVTAAKDASGFTRVFQNAYRVRIRGLEYEARWQPGAGTTVSLSQSFVRIGAGNPVTADDDTPRELELSAPRQRTTLFLMSRLPGDWRASATHHWVGRMKWPAEGDWQPKYRRLDLRLAKPFRIGTGRAEAAVTVQNAFDRYIEFRDRADPIPAYYFTRRAFATLSLEF